MHARLIVLAAAALPVQVSSTCSCPYWYGESSCPGDTTCPDGTFDSTSDHADEVLADIDTKVIARFLGAE